MDALIFTRRDEPIMVNDISGIPLTVALLEKCGFVKVLYDNDNKSEGEYLELKTEGFEYTLSDTQFAIWERDGYGEELIICQFLHELQNAYKVLEGTELTINL